MVYDVENKIPHFEILKLSARTFIWEMLYRIIVSLFVFRRTFSCMGVCVCVYELRGGVLQT